MNGLFRSFFEVSHIYVVYHALRKSKDTTHNNYDDFLQEGMIYLLKAIKYFNPELGFLFETYAEQAITLSS